MIVVSFTTMWPNAQTSVKTIAEQCFSVENSQRYNIALSNCYSHGFQIFCWVIVGLNITYFNLYFLRIHFTYFEEYARKILIVLTFIVFVKTKSVTIISLQLKQAQTTHFDMYFAKESHTEMHSVSCFKLLAVFCWNFRISVCSNLTRTDKIQFTWLK